MWLKVMLLTISFYMLAVLQNSFFSYLSFLGAVPNLVFVLFFLLIFFDKQRDYYPVVLWSVIAGFFIDVFSFTYFGVAIGLLLIVGILAKKIQKSLREPRQEFPLPYFLSLFIATSISYEILFKICAHFLNGISLAEILSLGILYNIIYNTFFAIIGFFVYKKVIANAVNKNQLKLL